MCGIVGAAAAQNVAPVLLEGLKRLAYRGYDSAGIGSIGSRQWRNSTDSHRRQSLPIAGGFARPTPFPAPPALRTPAGRHMARRWKKTPTLSISNADIAIVHNGIIENHDSFRPLLLEKGYQFTSETDTEVAAHLIHHYLQQHDFLTAVRLVAQQLEGLLRWWCCIAVSQNV